MKFAQIALLSAVSLSVAQHHNHVHRHPARHGSPIEARAEVTEVVPGPVVTVYELQGQDISYADVEQGLKDGKYVLVGDDTSTVVPTTTSAAPTPSSTPAPAPSTSEAAEFIQQKAQTSTSEKPAPTTSAAPAPKPTTSADSSSSASSSSSSSSGNVNSDFPSGTISCDTFPSQYGPVYVDWLGLGGWTGVQNTPGFGGDLSASTPIVQIATAISGSGCTANSFCSYACPAGYQKSQWPQSQGSTGESIGGLYCNSNGFLELSRTGVSQLCTAGAGGVQVTNNLGSGQNVAICRTDYPGTEGETIPLNTLPGQTYPLTNPISADYYTWGGAATTAQYYINPSGAALKDACVWGSAGSNLGNWAPVNVGVGVGAGDITYISVFPNSPTNPDGVLNFNIKITGDVSGDCAYTSGKYYSNGVEAVHGCTVAVSSGNTATFVFSS